MCPKTKINLFKARLCCAELNLEIKFNKSTGAQLLDQTYELSSGKQLSSKSSGALRDSNTAALQKIVLLPHETKFINCIIVFWRDCVPGKSYEENLLRGFSIS